MGRNGGMLRMVRPTCFSNPGWIFRLQEVEARFHGRGDFGARRAEDSSSDKRCFMVSAANRNYCLSHNLNSKMLHGSRLPVPQNWNHIM